MSMFTFVYVTASSKEEAEKIAKHLLEKRLVACVNIFPIKSYFWWEGKIDTAEEYGMILKTKNEKFSEIRDEIKKLHSYTTPCICSFPVDKALREFLEWIENTVE